MSIRAFVGASTAVVLGLLSQTAGAVIIYSQAPSAGGESFYSSRDALQQNADRFVLSQDTALNTISWWGTATGGGLDGFSVRIFSDDGGLPAATSALSLAGAVTQSATPLTDSAGADVFRYDLTGSFSLLAGSYHLSITNDDGISDWFWLSSASGDGESYFRGADEDLWESLPGDLAFSLDADQTVNVPEPGTLGLLGLGLLGIAMRRRSRRNGVETAAV